MAANKGRYSKDASTVRLHRKNKFDDISRLICRIEGLVELVAITVIYYLVWRTNYRTDDSPFYGKGKFVLAGVYFALAFIILYLSDGFKFGYLHMSDIVISQCISFTIVNVITYFQICLIVNHMVTPLYMLLLTIADACVSILMVGIFNKIYGLNNIPQKMVLIYGSDNAVDIKFKMDTRLDKYQITTIANVNRGFEEICAIIDEHDAVILNDVSAQIRNDILKYCYANEIRTYIVPKISDIALRGAEEISLFDTPLLRVDGSGLSPLQSFAKRVGDLVFSIAALVIFSPVMAATAILIKAEDHGSVLYKQTRVTKDEKRFEILKFRSMVENAEKDGISVPATNNDARITKVGRILRKTRMDELPQLFNIIKGDMSIVGPRPERVEHVEKYCSLIPEFKYRYKVKGGLTGYAQVYGTYNTSAYDKLRLDLMYIEKYSLMLDIKLIFMTLRVLLKKESTEGFDSAKSNNFRDNRFMPGQITVSDISDIGEQNDKAAI